MLWTWPREAAPEEGEQTSLSATRHTTHTTLRTHFYAAKNKATKDSGAETQTLHTVHFTPKTRQKKHTRNEHRRRGKGLETTPQRVSIRRVAALFTLFYPNFRVSTAKTHTADGQGSGHARRGRHREAGDGKRRRTQVSQSLRQTLIAE